MSPNNSAADEVTDTAENTTGLSNDAEGSNGAEGSDGNGAEGESGYSEPVTEEQPAEGSEAAKPEAKEAEAAEAATREASQHVSATATKDAQAAKQGGKDAKTNGAGSKSTKATKGSAAKSTAASMNASSSKSTKDKNNGGIAALASPSVQYYVHRQTYGWENKWSKSNGQASGTTGESKRLEGIKIRLSGSRPSGSIQYNTHVQNYGWRGWSSNGAMSGTTGESKRLEAIKIKLTGNMAKKYDVYYRVHAQKFGWMGWAKNGASAGTAGYSYRLEAIQIVLVTKGGKAPAATYKNATRNTTAAFKERKSYPIKTADAYETQDIKVSVPKAWRGEWNVDVNSENGGTDFYFYNMYVEAGQNSRTYVRGRVLVYDSPAAASKSTWWGGMKYLGRSSRGKYVYKYTVYNFFERSGEHATLTIK